MALTDVAIRAAKPKEKPYKLGDSGGLFLLIQPSGGKLWRFKYRIDGREKKLAIGSYPDIGLAEARSARDDARKLVAEGLDPSLEKRRTRELAKVSAGHTFNELAAEYVAKRSREGWAERTRAKADWLLDHFKSNIGNYPVSRILPSDILAVVKRAEARGNLETARRLLQMASNVFCYSVATARLASDPTRDLRGALISPQVKHHAAIIDPAAVGGLLRAIEDYAGNISTRFALRLAPHVFARPGELRQARWAEFDMNAAVWTIPAEKMKMRRPHHIPLSGQVIALLNELRELTGERSAYVFPSLRTTSRPLSENTINGALRRLGFSTDEMTAHGFRALASTLLNESGKWHPDAIERALAHKDADLVRAAYHRGAHWNERVQMAQWWSDHLDTLRHGGEVVPILIKRS